jgi:amphi-Trp domain-containing protein
MPEEVLFKSELRQNRSEVADYLRTVADKLDDGGSLTLSAGGDSVTLDPPESVTFEVKAELETGSGPDEHSVEFELEWDEGDAQGGESTGLDIS